MPLTETQLTVARKWLEARLLDLHCPCCGAVCGVAADLWALARGGHTPGPGGAAAGPPGWPVVVLLCGQCGHLRLFDAGPMKLGPAAA